MDTRRLVLFVIFSMSILMLWDSWQRQHAPIEANHSSTSSVGVSQQNLEGNTKISTRVDSDYKLLSNHCFL